MGPLVNVILLFCRSKDIIFLVYRYYFTDVNTYFANLRDINRIPKKVRDMDSHLIFGRIGKRGVKARGSAHHDEVASVIKLGWVKTARNINCAQRILG